MLAFDIETTGLSALDGHHITVICTEDFHSRARKAYEFARVRDDPEKWQALREDVLRDFEDAPALAAFNGHRFDLPFMAVALDIPVSTVIRWKHKMVDIFESCKTKYNHTFSLNLLCEKNKIPVKISSGLAAIKMAADGEFDSLREYCEYDVEIINQLHAQRFVLNPRNDEMMDLADLSPEYVYPEVVSQTSTEKMALAVEAWTALKTRSTAERVADPLPTEDHGDVPDETNPVKRQRLELPDMLEG